MSPQKIIILEPKEGKESSAAFARALVNLARAVALDRQQQERERAAAEKAEKKAA